MLATSTWHRLRIASLIAVLWGANVACAQWCPGQRDWAQLHVGLTLPKLEQLESRYPGIQNLKPYLSSGPRPAVLALFAGRFADVEEHFAKWAAAPPSEALDELNRFYNELDGRKLLALDAIETWRRAHPASRAAIWAQGALLAAAGWDARGEAYAPKTSRENFMRMDERFRAAETLLKPLEQGDDAYTLHTALMTANIYMAQGKRDQGIALFRSLTQRAPRSRVVYRGYMHFAAEKWVGSRAAIEAQNILARAKAAGFDPPFVVELRHAAEANDVNPWDSPDPAARKRFWVQRVKELPALANYRHIAHAEEYTKDWGSLLETTDAMVKLDPLHREARELRGYAQQNLGRNEAALQDYLAATALGSERAMSALIQAQLTGALGLKRKDIPALIELCRFGASLGLPSAANCMGALHDEIPEMRDPAKSLGWHLRGARGGHWNSQHDLGWVVYNGSRGYKHEQMGIFWLSRAAAQGHEFARRKLEQEIKLPPECGAKPK